MSTYIEAQQRTDAFLEKKVQEICKMNHKIMGKSHSKEFRWNTKGASLLHFEHIAFVILRDYLIEAVRRGVEGSDKDVRNCINQNVILFIMDQANVKMKSHLWAHLFGKFDDRRCELDSPYFSANWLIIAMRIWFDAHSDEKDTLGSKVNWKDTTVLRKYIITNLHNPEHPFNDFFNDTDYKILVDTFRIPYLSPEAEEELNPKPEVDDPKKDALIDALEQLYEKLDSGKSSLKNVSEELGALLKTAKDIFTQGGTIATAAKEISAKLEKISNQNTEIATDVQEALDNISKIWEDKFANEEDRLAHEKAVKDDKLFLDAFLAKYSTEHKGWLQKHTKGQEIFYTIKKEDRLLNSILFKLFDERPAILRKAIDERLRYDEKGDYKVIPECSITDARKRWNANRNGN